MLGKSKCPHDIFFELTEAVIVETTQFYPPCHKWHSPSFMFWFSFQTTHIQMQSFSSHWQTLTTKKITSLLPCTFYLLFFFINIFNPLTVHFNLCKDWQSWCTIHLSHATLTKSQVCCHLYCLHLSFRVCSLVYVNSAVFFFFAVFHYFSPSHCFNFVELVCPTSTPLTSPFRKEGKITDKNCCFIQFHSSFTYVFFGRRLILAPCEFSIQITLSLHESHQITHSHVVLT